MALIELECQQKVDSMKKECDDRIAAGEADYESKVKQVLREVNTKIVTQEQESHKAIDDAIREFKAFHIYTYIDTYLILIIMPFRRFNFYDICRLL